MCAFFEDDNMNDFMKEALKEAQKSYKCGDVPIGAVIVQNGKMVAKAHNKKEKNKSAIEHAEILAIKKACKKNKNWRLDNCTIYVTMEPCLMCLGAIYHARISKIVYAIENENYGAVVSNFQLLNTNYLGKKIIIEKGNYEQESKHLVQNFFKQRRK